MGCLIAVLSLPLTACGAPTSAPTAPIASADPQVVTVSGAVTDRIGDRIITGSTITFDGSTSRTATVTAGRYEISDLPIGNYRVTISSPLHVTHETTSAVVSSSSPMPFSVLPWGPTALGAVYDETFQRYFHQLARVTDGSATFVRKWIISPTELYVVQGTVPQESLDLVVGVLGDMNVETIPDLWCHTAGSLKVIVGPDVAGDLDGRIIVRPNWAEGSSGTVGATRAGTVRVNVFGPGINRLFTREELTGILSHELFHVAGAFHVCGGDVGTNPFGFSPTNCPYPDSLMANLGAFVTRMSPEDRLAACIIYHPDTHNGNQFPDKNPTYR
jgi:hypothetical protein